MSDQHRPMDNIDKFLETENNRVDAFFSVNSYVLAPYTMKRILQMLKETTGHLRRCSHNKIDGNWVDSRDILEKWNKELGNG